MVTLAEGESNVVDASTVASCNLIKIGVLAGAATTIERLRPALFVENNTLDRSRPLLELQQSLLTVLIFLVIIILIGLRESILI
jgi:hypothetical protein